MDLHVSERPTAGTSGLRILTRALDDVVESHTDARVVAPRVGTLLRGVLNDLSLLEPRHQEPAPDRYRQHVVHVHPAGKYSIVALVWKPGQATPIHDHCCWCVVGVWQGIERESEYRLGRDRRGLHLAERRSRVAGPGDVAVLVPPEEDIHRVENAGLGLAISIHVYGDDISVRGTSINRTFPDELVRNADRTATRVSWRTLAA